MFIWSKAEVQSYLGAILGRVPDPDRSGRVKVPGPSRACHERGHRAIMSILTGEWHCPGCSAGPLEEYEARRSGVFFTSMAAPRIAADDIRLVISKAQDERRERMRCARMLIEQCALPAPTATLLRHIARKPGVSRRTLQHLAHLRRRKFRSALRELERKGLMSHQEVSSTAGRTRQLYFLTPFPESPVSI